MEGVKYYFTTKKVCTCGTKMPDIYRNYYKTEDKKKFKKDNKIVRMCCISSLDMLTCDLMSDIDSGAFENEITLRKYGVSVTSEIPFKSPIF
jgi:hypothetical protein